MTPTLAQPIFHISRNNLMFLILFGLWIISATGVVCSESEKALYYHLFHHYDPVPRPVSNSSSPVVINFGIALNQILDLDEKKQTLTTSTWIKEGWYDDALQWNTTDFGGLDQLMVSSSYLWVPDIFIFNTGGGELEGFVNVTGSKVLIKSNGYVTWTIPLMIKSSCAVDVTYFPYDKQTCDIHFGSWIYDHSKVDLQILPDNPDMSGYVENNEFDLLDIQLYRTMVNESCCPGSGSHPMISIKICMDRKSMYYDYIVIAPTIMLCILTLVTFMLPCHHGEKIAIGLTVFLTLYVLQLLIAENVPDTNTTPILGIFIFLVMTLNCISLILATLVMSIKKKSTLKPIPNVPPMVLSFCKTYLSRITCTNTESRLHKYDICSSESDDSIGSHGSTKLADRISDDDDINDVTSKLNTSGNYGDDYHSDDDEDESDLDNEYEQYCELELNSCKNDTSSQTALLQQDKIKDKLNEQCSYRQILRNRRSYRKAIFRNNMKRTARSSFAKYSSFDIDDAEVVIRGKEELMRKREWCFIAETVDKSSFLVYTICMFVTVFAVLVLVPSIQ